MARTPPKGTGTSKDTVGKRVTFDRETWNALDLMARDKMMTLQELADEAFRDLLKKHGRPTDLRSALRQSARDIAAIIGQIKAQKIPAVFLENVTDPRLMQQIAKESGARVGGKLYSDALTDEKGDATTYIDLIRHNLGQLASALSN